MCASKVSEGNNRGWIIPIGGAEDKENSPQILNRFVALGRRQQRGYCHHSHGEHVAQYRCRATSAFSATWGRSA